MALSKDLEEELTCPIHLEYFEEPMLLKCLHLLFQKDVDRMLDDDELLQCPVCKRISEKRDIKKDFRTKRLIDIVKGDASKLKQNQICDVCDEEPASSLCRDCEMYFRKQCVKVHKKMPVSKSHKVDDITDIISEAKEQIQKYMLDIKKLASEYEQTRDECVKTKEETTNSQIFATIQESENAIIKETKRVHDELRKQVKLKLSKYIEPLDTAIENLKSKLGLISRKMQILRDVIESDDSKTLLNKEFITELIDPSLTEHDKTTTGETLPTVSECMDIHLSSKNHVIQELRKLQIATKDTPESVGCPPQANSEQVYGAKPKKSTDSLQSIDKSKPVASTSSPVVTSNSKPEKKQMVQNPIRVFTEYLDKSLDSKVLCNFQDQASSISVIGNDIWIVFESGNIGIYQESANRSAQKMKSIAIHSKECSGQSTQNIFLYKARKVVSVNDGTIIAAHKGLMSMCDGDGKDGDDDASHTRKMSGLVIIDSNGLILETVTAGWFYNDVCCDDQHVYGLNGSIVGIFNKNDQGWFRIKSISLKTFAFGLCVVNDKMVLSYSFPDRVASYDLESNVEQQLASMGREVGQFKCPSVSCCDKDGNVLICDRNNNRIQVLLADNTLKAVNVIGELQNPHDAAVSSAGSLYVLSERKLYVLID